MEVGVASSTPARPVPGILTGELQAQLPVHVTPQAKDSQYIGYDQTQNQKQQKQPPHNNRPKRLLLRVSSYPSIEHVGKDSNNIHYSQILYQHEDCQEKG